MNFAENMGESEFIKRPSGLGFIVLIGILIVGSLGLGIWAGQANPRYQLVTITQQGPVIIQTKMSYVTQTETQVTAVMQSYAVTVTQTVGPAPGYLPQGGCNYPFDAYYCALEMGDLPPQTITGYLTSDGSCWFLYGGYGYGATGNYVLYNVPGNASSLLSKPVQVFGYVYGNWPSGTLFPPYQAFTFHTPLCVGTPVWVIEGPISY